MLLADAHASKALEHWESSNVHLGSKLILFECQVVIHRCQAKMPSEVYSEWNKNAQQWLGRISESLILHEMDDRVLLTAKATPELGACRTLDAIHLATALVFRAEGALLEISSFDNRFTTAAQSLELAICS